MKRYATMAAAVLVFLSATAAQLSAQQAKPVRELAVIAQNITASNETASGKERSQDIALPGDVIEYRLVFTNTRDFGMKDVVFQDPIPSGLFYLASTARASREDVVVEYSVDSGKTWSAKPMTQVLENGVKVMRPASPEAYTNVRWRVTGMVAPGASVEAQFRARVSVPDAASKK